MRNRLYTFFLCLITLFAGCTRGLWLDEIVAQRDEQEEVVPILEAAQEKGLTVDSVEEIERTNKYYTVDTANGYYNEFKRYRIVFSDQTTVEFDVLGTLNGVQREYYAERGLDYIDYIDLDGGLGKLYISIVQSDGMGGGLSFPYTTPNGGENTPENNKIYYTSTDGGVVTPNDAGAFGANIVSNTYENGQGVITFDRDVTEIGYAAFASCSHLESIIIPNGVTSIGDDAFNGCLSLANITIPESVTSIGLNAFGGNLSLVSIIIPPRVSSIGGAAFSGCTSLASITIPEGVISIEGYTFSNCTSLASVTIPEGVTSIDSWAFEKCSSLVSITIPESVTSIGDSAFYRCSSLASITIPEGVTSIGRDAFNGCSSLTSITIPDSVTSIGQGAFYNCSSLTSITIPDGVTSIGYYAFRRCSSLAEVYCKAITPPTAIPNSSSRWDAFDDNASGRKIYVPAESVEAYKTAEWWSEYSDAFIPYDYRKIYYTSTDGNVVTPYATNVFGANIVSNTYENGQGVITFDGEVTKIGIDAFRECTSLKSVSIPGGVIEIVGAFWGCSSLTSITIPNSVTMIGDNSFFNCSSLTSVTIPNSITRIRGHAFWGCTSLTSITIPNSVTLIGEYAFANCTSLTSFYSKFASKDGRCLIVGGELNSFAPAGLTEYIIPNSITSIGTFAFYSCSLLTSITIPSGVTSIEWAAFDICTSLASVYCKPTVPPSGNYHMFTGNASGRKIYVPAESVEAYKTAQYWSDYADDIVGYSF